jgi:hypothetical protein
MIQHFFLRSTTKGNVRVQSNNFSWTTIKRLVQVKSGDNSVPHPLGEPRE